jgi:hypothetical protein
LLDATAIVCNFFGSFAFKWSAMVFLALNANEYQSF